MKKGREEKKWMRERLRWKNDEKNERKSEEMNKNFKNFPNKLYWVLCYKTQKRITIIMMKYKKKSNHDEVQKKIKSD